MNWANWLRLWLIAGLLVVFDFMPAAAQTAPPAALCQRQLVYVPVYSHIYYGDQEQKLLLTGILSLRNTDPSHPITITRADYYDSGGNLIRKYVSQPLVLKPLASTRFIVKETDTQGGSGAHFLVGWQAETAVNEPLMEGVMIGTAGQQGISFTSRGKAVRAD
ncbi:MAG: DUF3124 domain-containing protein [Desulfobaccales bacterium]